MEKINYLEDSATTTLKKRTKNTRELIRKKEKFRGEMFSRFTAFVGENTQLFSTQAGFLAIRDTWYIKKINIRVMELMEEFYNTIKDEATIDPAQIKAEL